MQASKVTITPETQEAIRFRPLSKKQKRKLRQDRIKELIASRKPFTRIMTKEFGAVTDLPDNTVWSIVRGMARRGEIQMINLSKRTYGFALPGDIKVTKLPSQQQVPELEALVSDGPPPVGNVGSLTGYAKEFAWATNSDSLREFVGWMDGKELQLLRGGDK